MPLLAISDVQVGAVLARPIEDSMGRILINAGEALTPQLLTVLKKRGFVEVEVRPEATQNAGETEDLENRVAKRYTDVIKHDADALKIRKEMEARFHNVPETNKLMKVLRLVAENTLINKRARAKGIE